MAVDSEVGGHPPQAGDLPPAHVTHDQRVRDINSKDVLVGFGKGAWGYVDGIYSPECYAYLHMHHTRIKL